MTEFGGYDALRVAVWAFEDYSAAKTPAMQAHYFIQLMNAMSDLASWHPEFDINTGRVGEYDE